MWLAIAVALSSASQSIQASSPTYTYTSGTVSAYGSGGYARGTYSSTSTTYNSAATIAAQAQIRESTMRQMTEIVTVRDIQLERLSSMLRRNTVRKGEIVSGVIKLEAKNIKVDQPLYLTVTIGSEVHEFIFNIMNN